MKILGSNIIFLLLSLLLIKLFNKLFKLKIGYLKENFINQDNFNNFNNCNILDKNIYLCSNELGDRTYLGKYDLVCDKNNNSRYYWKKENFKNIFYIDYDSLNFLNQKKETNKWKIIKYSKEKNEYEILFTNSNIKYSCPLGNWKRYSNNKYSEPITRNNYDISSESDYSKFLNYFCKPNESCRFNKCLSCFDKCNIDPNIRLNEIKYNKDCIEDCLESKGVCGPGDTTNYNHMNAFLNLWKKQNKNIKLLKRNRGLVDIILNRYD